MKYLAEIEQTFYPQTSRESIIHSMMPEVTQSSKKHFNGRGWK
jgi:hypothetical protein